MSLNEKNLETMENTIVETIQTNNLQELKNTLEQIFDICADLVEHPLQLKTKRMFYYIILKV